MGNKAAVFPLQLLGLDVDVVNSVHFSNHTGYTEGWEGDVLGGDQLRKILQGLERNGLLTETGHLLTGYIGSESFLQAVLEVLQTVRRYNSVRFVCDPVLGDKGRFYVPETLVEVYRSSVIPLADLVTPNQFETEQLTGIKVDSLESAMTACKALHDMGPSMVVITSVVLDTAVETMSMIASQRVGTKDQVYKIDFPLLPGHFTGTGDLCAALLLAHTAQGDLAAALEATINTMARVLERTAAAAGETVQSRELQLIQSKSDIERPPARFKAVRVR